ncbi:hypothetical protein PHYSODRAFT_519033, partial [Phytophthora sojae]
SSPLACWAPPRRKECEVRLLVAPAGSATRFKKRLTYAWTPSDTQGASCITRATASVCRGQVRKSSRSGTRVRPCSSAVFTRSMRT